MNVGDAGILQKQQVISRLDNKLKNVQRGEDRIFSQACKQPFPIL